MSGLGGAAGRPPPWQSDPDPRWSPGHPGLWLVTEIDDNIKYGMIEAISHLIHRDYEAIVEDFVTLQFIDPGTNLTPILPVLAKVSLCCLTSVGLHAFHALCEVMLSPSPIVAC